MQDPLEYLYGLNNTNIRLGLGPISRLLYRLNNPHSTFETVLIGGTNGKGSVAAMVASILEHGGLKVGFYSSPHLLDIRERIIVNGTMITWEEITICIAAVRKKLLEDITFFEFLTAVAFIHFKNVKVDIAVLEVGMGGRLDATNVVKPLVSVISNISFDHQSYLGDTLDKIATEKGGIIKNRGVCITAAKQKRVINVLEEICLQRNATLLRLGRDMRFRINPDGTFNYIRPGKSHRDITCPLLGKHQIANAVLAICAIESMREKGLDIDDDAIIKGIRNTQWEGRLEILQYNPLVLVDGAHNPAGVSALCKALRQEIAYDRLILIFGVLNDKDHVAMLKKIAPLASHLIVTKPQVDRAMQTDRVKIVALRYMKHNVEIIENSSNALKCALSLADVNDLICVTGSLYLVGEIKKLYRQYANNHKNEILSIISPVL